MTTRQAIWGMHLVALAWGSSAVFGSLISVPSQEIVLGRCIFAVLTLLLIFRKRPIVDFLSLNRKLKCIIALSGTLLGIHWVFFFLSIKLSGVALALVTYATASTQIAIGEVIFLKAKFRPIIIIAAVVSLLGVFTIHPAVELNQLLDKGLIFGLLSASFISVMALMVKYILTEGVSAVTYSSCQLFFATLVSIPFALTTGLEPIGWHDLLYILALGTFCSALGQCTFNACARHVRMSSAAVIAMMEVPYGILLAAIFIGDKITLNVIAGIILVTLSAIMVSLKKAN